MQEANGGKCPGCGGPLEQAADACPRCGLPLRGPVAHELWQVDVAIAGLDGERARLLARRTELLAVLRRSPAPPAPPNPPRRELSVQATQNMLLVLGGLLLIIAAFVFTVVSWGHLGIGGRAAVLAGLTALVLAAPVVLLRRGLTATAETMAAFGVALMVLDGYAARQVGLAGSDALPAPYYTALVCGLIAALLAGYARLVRVRLAAPGAVVFAQGVLVMPALKPGGDWIAAAFLLAAALDTLAWMYLDRRQRGTAVKATAAVCGAVAAGFGMLLAAYSEAAIAQDVTRALTPAALLAAAAIGILVIVSVLARGEKAPDAVRVLTAVAVVAFTVAVATLLGHATDGGPVGWRLVACMVVSLALCGGTFALPDALVRRAATVTAGIIVPLWLLPMAPEVIATLVAPLRRAVESPWQHAALIWGIDWPPASTAAPAALLLLTAAALIVRARHRRAEPVALVTAAVALAVVPVAFRLPEPAAVAVVVALTAALAVPVARLKGRRAPLYGVVAVLAACHAAAWALNDETATLAALPVLAVVAAAVAVTGRAAGVRPAAAGAAVVLLGGEALAVGISAGLPRGQAAFPVLAVAALAALTAARTSTLGTEIGGYVLAGAGILLTAPDPRLMSLSCAAAGVLAAGTALRPDRRRHPTFRTAAALLLAATWLRLWAEDVGAVEAYTAPFSLVLLGFGWWRVRRAAEGSRPSSWSAYGPGLAFTMLPSLLVALSDPGWVRPLLLGCASLAVLLAGARWRMQAPVVQGGFTLAVLGINELMPWISDLVVLLPRWVPIAVGGALLVAIGATYEARKRDVRRLRDALARLG
ncbi:SCO7613 C-terminal domain-containing membrane protein [Spongiactinospora sp. 9N601]|uniref:SCO7613 C-terminal domain-containing membrane protein n=1 Tax=Spongiactinospora sp. 9N601 TaxID=3375149 RepID=UPI003793AEEA